MASRWHALVTCGPGDLSQPRYPNGNGNSETPSRLNSMTSAYSESDLESLDIVTMPTTTQLASYMSSYHKRQAFGKKLRYIPQLKLLSMHILNSINIFLNRIFKTL